MIALFTDFGLEGPYTGQVKAVLAEQAPGVEVIDLFADLPAFNVKAAAYLLPAYSRYLPADTVCVCVVDPGVGGAREAIAVRADGRWYVGPDNGLLSRVVHDAGTVQAWRIDFRPERLSASFHGRDLFAPVAAMIARHHDFPSLVLSPAEIHLPDWPADLAEVVYIDRYGNAVTGVRACAVDRRAQLEVNGVQVRPARTFSDLPPGAALWYENANGLVEVAVNQGPADRSLDIGIGCPVSFV